MTVKNAVKQVVKLKRGFTLIELLVVVLIIGILAAVAVPQYQKAVRKAKFAEVGTMFSSLSRAVDMWLLEENNYSSVWGTINGTNSRLSIDFPCNKIDDNGCYNKTGRWRVYNGGSAYAIIYYEFRYDADGNTGNTWFTSVAPSQYGGDRLEFTRGSNGVWNLSYVVPDEQAFYTDICQWWKSTYGLERLVGSAAVHQCK